MEKISKNINYEENLNKDGSSSVIELILEFKNILKT